MSYPNQPPYPPPPYGVDPGYCSGPPTTVCFETEIGNCPACRQGNLTSNITCLGVCCAILLFPLGLICLVLLQEQRCSHCGYCTS